MTTALGPMNHTIHVSPTISTPSTSPSTSTNKMTRIQSKHRRTESLASFSASGSCNLDNALLDALNQPFPVPKEGLTGAVDAKAFAVQHGETPQLPVDYELSFAVRRRDSIDRSLAVQVSFSDKLKTGHNNDDSVDGPCSSPMISTSVAAAPRADLSSANFSQHDHSMIGIDNSTCKSHPSFSLSLTAQKAAHSSNKSIFRKQWPVDGEAQGQISSRDSTGSSIADFITNEDQSSGPGSHDDHDDGGIDGVKQHATGVQPATLQEPPQAMDPEALAEKLAKHAVRAAQAEKARKARLAQKMQEAVNCGEEPKAPVQSPQELHLQFSNTAPDDDVSKRAERLAQNALCGEIGRKQRMAVKALVVQGDTEQAKALKPTPTAQQEPPTTGTAPASVEALAELLAQHAVRGEVARKARLAKQAGVKRESSVVEQPVPNTHKLNGTVTPGHTPSPPQQQQQHACDAVVQTQQPAQREPVATTFAPWAAASQSEVKTTTQPNQAITTKAVITKPPGVPNPSWSKYVHGGRDSSIRSTHGTKNSSIPNVAKQGQQASDNMPVSAAENPASIPNGMRPVSGSWRSQLPRGIGIGSKNAMKNESKAAPRSDTLTSATGGSRLPRPINSPTLRKPEASDKASAATTPRSSVATPRSAAAMKTYNNAFFAHPAPMPGQIGRYRHSVKPALDMTNPMAKYQQANAAASRPSYVPTTKTAAAAAGVRAGSTSGIGRSAPSATSSKISNQAKSIAFHAMRERRDEAEVEGTAQADFISLSNPPQSERKARSPALDPMHTSRAPVPTSVASRFTGGFVRGPNSILYISDRDGPASGGSGKNSCKPQWNRSMKVVTSQSLQPTSPRAHVNNRSMQAASSRHTSQHSAHGPKDLPECVTTVSSPLDDIPEKDEQGEPPNQWLFKLGSFWQRVRRMSSSNCTESRTSTIGDATSNRVSSPGVDTHTAAAAVDSTQPQDCTSTQLPSCRPFSFLGVVSSLSASGNARRSTDDGAAAEGLAADTQGTHAAQRSQSANGQWVHDGVAKVEGDRSSKRSTVRGIITRSIPCFGFW